MSLLHLPVLSATAVTPTILVLIETGSVLDFVLDRMGTFGRAVKWTGAEANGILYVGAVQLPALPLLRGKWQVFVLANLCW